MTKGDRRVTNDARARGKKEDYKRKRDGKRGKRKWFGKRLIMIIESARSVEGMEGEGARTRTDTARTGERSGEKWMGRIRREENRMAREAE